MLFFNTSNSPGKNFSHCHGCGLCALVCPVWQQTHDVSCAPHGHAKALQYGGKINVKGLFDCVLCGACEPVCPEDIEIMAMLIDLRKKSASSRPQGANIPAKSATRQNKQDSNKTDTKTHEVLLLADEALSHQPALLGRVLELLSGEGVIGQAQDNGSDISLALQSGTTISSKRRNEFIDSIKYASRLVISDGLLKNAIQDWLPAIEIISLGYALSNLPAIQQKLGAKDLYIIETQAYHADFDRLVTHYDRLRRSSGCELNLDLQRLAIPTGGIGADFKQAPYEAAAGFDVSRQCQWILQGLDIERIVVENVEDGIVMKNVSNKPVIHVAELAGSA